MEWAPHWGKVSFQSSENSSPSDLTSWQAYSGMLNIAFLFLVSRLGSQYFLLWFCLHPGKIALLILVPRSQQEVCLASSLVKYLGTPPHTHTHTPPHPSPEHAVQVESSAYLWAIIVGCEEKVNGSCLRRTSMCLLLLRDCTFNFF